MAEVLVKATSAFDILHPQSEMALPKRGMPIVIMPDGHRWGVSEGLPDYVVIKTPGMAVAAINHLTEIETQNAAGVDVGGMYRFRRWFIDVDSIVFNNGVAYLSLWQLAAKTTRISDGAKWQPL